MCGRPKWAKHPLMIVSDSYQRKLESRIPLTFFKIKFDILKIVLYIINVKGETHEEVFKWCGNSVQPFTSFLK
jgi:hypothetical protein